LLPAGTFWLKFDPTIRRLYGNLIIIKKNIKNKLSFLIYTGTPATTDVVEIASGYK
jgi:hypothetical protein